MIAYGWDIESFLIRPGLLAPRSVCLSHATRSTPDDFTVGLGLRDYGIDWLHAKLEDPDALLIAHNLPFDLVCKCADAPALLWPAFKALRENRLCCTITRQKILDVAMGMREWRRFGDRVERATYGLDDLVRIYFGVVLDKGNPWRLRFCELDGVPVEQWPERDNPLGPEAYAVGDSVWAARIREAQTTEMIERFGDVLPDESVQQRATVALHLMSTWGVRADEEQVDRFLDNCEREVEKMRDDLRGTGIFDERKGSRSMKEIRRRVVASFERLNLAVPMTEPSARFPDGQVKTDSEVLDQTDDPHLHALNDSMVFDKMRNQWGPVCRAAVHRPVCARYNVLVNNGRTSCSGSEGQEGTNFQNPNRRGDVRPCFIPRLGRVYCSTDADTIELRANAQNCLDMGLGSRMAEVLWDQYRNGGPDLHTTFAAAILGISPKEADARLKAGDQEVENARQLAKHANFGLAGGMGAFRFVLMCHGFGVRLADDFESEIERAKELKRLWLETWSEMVGYFARIGSMVDEERGYVPLMQHLPAGLMRGRVRYAAAANSYFSGRVAAGMKESLWRLAHECYTGETIDGKPSVLYGSRPVMFLHDEPILEHPEDGSEEERAERQRVIVVESLQSVMKDVPITSTAVLMRRWLKGVKPVRIDGKLVPSKPEAYMHEGKEAIKWVADLRA